MRNQNKRSHIKTRNYKSKRKKTEIMSKLLIKLKKNEKHFGMVILS